MENVDPGEIVIQLLLRLDNVNEWRMLIQVCQGATAGDELTAGQGLHSVPAGRLLWSAADTKGGRLSTTSTGGLGQQD